MNRKLWEEFLNNKVGINCKTQEEAELFFKYCKENEITKWVDGDILSNTHDWHTHQENTYYACEELEMYFGNIKNITRLKIVTYKDLLDFINEYYFDEILKMIRVGILKNGDKYKNTNGVTYTVGEFGTPNLYASQQSLVNAKFKIKEKEYMTFDEVEKLGTPKHKDYGYDITKFNTTTGLKNFVKEMDKKVWFVEE